MLVKLPLAVGIDVSVPIAAVTLLDAAFRREIAPPALIAIGTVPLKAPPLVVVAQVGQVTLPVALEIAKGDDAVTAGVPLLVPAVQVEVPATDWVLIVNAPLVKPLIASGPTSGS